MKLFGVSAVAAALLSTGVSAKSRMLPEASECSFCPNGLEIDPGTVAPGDLGYTCGQFLAVGTDGAGAGFTCGEEDACAGCAYDADYSAVTGSDCQWISDGEKSECRLTDNRTSSSGDSRCLSRSAEYFLCNEAQENQYLCCPSAVPAAANPCPVCPGGITAEEGTVIPNALPGWTCETEMAHAQTFEEGSEDCGGALALQNLCCPTAADNATAATVTVPAAIVSTVAASTTTNATATAPATTNVTVAATTGVPEGLNATDPATLLATVAGDGCSFCPNGLEVDANTTVKMGDISYLLLPSDLRELLEVDHGIVTPGIEPGNTGVTCGQFVALAALIGNGGGCRKEDTCADCAFDSDYNTVTGSDCQWNEYEFIDENVDYVFGQCRLTDGSNHCLSAEGVCSDVKEIQWLCCPTALPAAVNPCPLCPDGLTAEGEGTIVPADVFHSRIEDTVIPAFSLNKADGTDVYGDAALTCKAGITHAQSLEEGSEDCYRASTAQLLCCYTESVRADIHAASAVRAAETLLGEVGSALVNLFGGGTGVAGTKCAPCADGFDSDFAKDNVVGDTGISCYWAVSALGRLDSGPMCDASKSIVESACCPSQMAPACAFCPAGLDDGDTVVPGSDGQTCGAIANYTTMVTTASPSCAEVQGAQIVCCPAAVSAAADNATAATVTASTTTAATVAVPTTTAVTVATATDVPKGVNVTAPESGAAAVGWVEAFLPTMAVAMLVLHG